MTNGSNHWILCQPDQVSITDTWPGGQEVLFAATSDRLPNHPKDGRATDSCFALIGMDEIPWVSSRYKYLGCVIDEFLDCSRMVEHRVKLGSQALGAWLRRCRESVGEVNG